MRRIVVIVALMVLGLTGCVPADVPSPVTELAGQPGMDRIAGTWTPQRPVDSPSPEPMECPAGLSFGSDGFWAAVGPYPAEGSWILGDDGVMHVFAPDGYGGGDYPYCDAVFLVVQAVTAAAAVSLDDGVLVVRDADDAEIIRFLRTSEDGPTPMPVPSASAAPSLPSTFVGEWTADGWDLQLTEGLLVSGSADCNDVRGRWSEFGSAYFSAYRSLRPCDIPQTWRTLISARVQGDELTVSTDSGDSVVLHRTSATGSADATR